MLLAIAAAAAGPLDLSGVWRVTMEIVTAARIPVLGTTDIHTYQTMLATVSADGPGFTVHHQTCTFRAESRPSLATTHFPQAFVDAIPDRDYRLELVDGAAGPAGSMHVGFVAVGWDPALGSFPERLDAPSVVDWDHDTAPAATVQLQVPIFGTVDVYQVQAQDLWFDAASVSADAIVGTVRIEGMRSRTLGATNRLFIQNPKLQQLPGRSPFRFERAPPGTTCATLR